MVELSKRDKAKRDYFSRLWTKVDKIVDEHDRMLEKYPGDVDIEDSKNTFMSVAIVLRNRIEAIESGVKGDYNEDRTEE
jgi:hypothetical protein